MNTQASQVAPTADLPASGISQPLAFGGAQQAARADTTLDVDNRVATLVDATWAFSAFTAAVEMGLLSSVDSAATVAELATRTGLNQQLVIALLDVLASAGLVRCDDARYAPVPQLQPFLDTSPREDLLARLRSAHFQSRALVDAARQGTLRTGWTHTDPQLLQAQGRSGRAMAHALAAQLFPRLPGLEQRLSSPGGVFLDIGMGVGILSIEMCRLYPHLRVVGLEPGAIQAQEARRNIAAAGLENRIEVRVQRLEDLDDRDAYDFAYLPQVFMPLDVVRPGLDCLREALRPGGWIAIMAIDAPGADLHATTARLLNVLWGGTPLDLEELIRLTREAGFEMVQGGGDSPDSVMKGVVGRRPLRH